MNSNFDLNLPFIDEETGFLFDQNQTPTNVEILNTEDDDVAIVNNPSECNEFVAETDSSNITTTSQQILMFLLIFLATCAFYLLISSCFKTFVYYENYVSLECLRWLILVKFHYLC